MNDRVERFLGFNSEPGKGRRLTPPLASRGTGIGCWEGVGFGG